MGNNLYLTQEHLEVMVEQELMDRKSADSLIYYMQAIADQIAKQSEESESDSKDNQSYDGLGFKNHLGIPFAIDRYLDYVEAEGVMPKITSVFNIMGQIGGVENEEEENK